MSIHSAGFVFLLSWVMAMIIRMRVINTVVLYIFYCSLVYNGFPFGAYASWGSAGEGSPKILLSTLPRNHRGQLRRLTLGSGSMLHPHQDESTHCDPQESKPRLAGHRQNYQPEPFFPRWKRREGQIYANGIRPHAAKPEDEQSAAESANPEFSKAGEAALLIGKPRGRRG